MRRWVVVAVPGDKRTLGFLAALAAQDEAPAVVIPWSSAIADPQAAFSCLRDGDVVRIESPGSDPAIWMGLVHLGGDGSARRIEAGHWRPGCRWFTGLKRGCASMAVAISAQAQSDQAVSEKSIAWDSHLPDILTMTDKHVCRQYLSDLGIPVPAGFAAPADPVALRAELTQRDWWRVFVKPRWGSSGAGVMAWQRSATGAEQLTTTCDIHFGADAIELHNRKRLRTYRDQETIDVLLARILSDGAVVERWIPKLGIERGPLDLRVVVIDGQPRHTIARVGRGPITNLHLDAQRLDPDELFSRGPARARGTFSDVCRAVGKAFPSSHHFGLDVLLDRTWKPWVVEVNAWGDYLPGLLDSGVDTYGAEITAARHRSSTPCML